MAARALVVLVSCPSPRQAKQLGKTLVAKRLAACVNILVGMESIFWWQGKIDQSKEALLVIKTTAPIFERLRTTIQALHPYEVPEMIALPITHAHQPYVRWIRNSLNSPKPKEGT